jgi:arginyl-tRNA synthetase
MKQILIKFLQENIENSETLDFEKLIEKPKQQVHGDFSFPCFLLSKTLGKPPVVIAQDLQKELEKILPNQFSKVSAMGPFLNFTINAGQITQTILKSIESNKFKDIKSNNPQKVLIEYPSPNTNKNLHIGHVRNILLGNSLINILKFTKNKVIKTSINNDRGIAICKAMIGYEMFHKTDTPQSLNLKPDEFVAKCYVEFEAATKTDESLNEKAQEMLVKWEANDKPTKDLWDKTLELVYTGYKETFENYKLGEFDKQYYESQIYDKGKEIVEDAIKNKIKGFQYDSESGAALVDFENETFGKKYLLRGDGTTLYMTQDLYLAKLKEETYKADKYVFIVGKEQKYHFEVLFEILERLGLGGADKNYHFAYGYVYNKDGTKFSSRAGNVVGADWLLSEMIENSKNNLLNKELTKDLPKEELNNRAKKIGYGALAFSMLNVNSLSDMKFDMEKALAFEGETGPYVQYTYARIKSILRKAEQENIESKNIDFNNYNESEVQLIKQLGEFENSVLQAEQKYKPSAISNYLVRVCQSFNEFYQNNKIIGGEQDKLQQRLLLIESTSKVIKQGLELLGIETLEEM